MIVIDQGQRRFNYRIAGLAVHEGLVLVHQGEGDGFWTLPGGRAEIGEPAEQTLRREMIEEPETEVEILRPLWFVENFFKFDGRDYHEIAVYFLMAVPDSAPVRATEGPYFSTDHGVRLTFQ